MSHGTGGRGRPAARADRRARRRRGARGLRLAGAPGRGRGARADQRLAHAPDRHLGRRAARQRRPRPRRRAPRRRTSRTSSCCSPARRSPDGRDADAHRARLHRLERAALRGVMVREIVNFSSFWRSSTFSSTVDPTIYLLAFGFGFGSLVSTRRRLRLHRLRRHRHRRHHGPVLGRVPGDVLDVRQVRRSSTPTTRSSPPPVDTEELVTAEALWIAARTGRLRLRADARRDGVRPRPELGHAARPVHRRAGRLRLGGVRDLHRRRARRRSRASPTGRAAC